MGVIIVNSTITTSRSMLGDLGGEVSPLHQWGLLPEKGDTLLCHRQNRYEIFFRRRFSPLVDPRVLIKVILSMIRGADGVYCVTQPDLIGAIPFLKRLFRSKPIIIWVWTRAEVRSWAKYLSSCDHIFALTQPALLELEAQGLGSRSSLQLWGCDSSYYRLEPVPSVTSDVLFFGLTKRDSSMVQRLAMTQKFRIAASRQAARLLGTLGDIKIVHSDSKIDLLHALYSSYVTLVPLFRDEPQPTGMTNVIESLLCGSSVVIPECSSIPSVILQLPGIYLYKAQEFDSFHSAVREAVLDAKLPARRSQIQHAAARVLNGSGLSAAIKRTINRSYVAPMALSESLN